MIVKKNDRAITDIWNEYCEMISNPINQVIEFYDLEEEIQNNCILGFKNVMPKINPVLDNNHPQYHQRVNLREGSIGFPPGVRRI